jgi:hypothetical protein
VAAHSRHKGAFWRIVEVLCLFADAVHAVVCEVALDAAVAWSLVAWGRSVLHVTNVKLRFYQDFVKQI